MRRVATYTTLVLGTVMAMVILWQFRAVILLFLLSLVVAAAVRPAVNSLLRLRVPLLVSLIITYVIGLSIVAILLQTIIAALVEELPQLTHDLAVAYEFLQPRWLEEGTPFQQAVAAQLPPPKQVYAAITGERGEMLVRTVFDITRGFILGIAGFISVLLLSVYWSADQVHFERLWLSLLPANRRAAAREIGRNIETNLGAYIRSEVTQSVIAGLLLAIGYLWIGLDYPVTLALVGALAWFIPVVGVLLVVFPVLLIGLLSNLFVAIMAALYTAVVLLILEVIVEPRLFVDRRRYSPLLTILLMIPLADAYGLPGLIFAPILAASLQITFGSLVAYNRESSMAKQPADQLGSLQQRLAAVQTLLTSPYYPYTPEVINFMDRLTTLIQRSNVTIQVETAVEPATSGKQTTTPDEIHNKTENQLPGQ